MQMLILIGLAHKLHMYNYYKQVSTLQGCLQTKQASKVTVLNGLIFDMEWLFV